MNVQSLHRPNLDSAWRHCSDIVRTQDRDRYVATLFAPADRRGDLFALYAFALEVARVRDVVSDPLPGEMRLQWWRDLLMGEVRGDASAHPVAAALMSSVRGNSLPVPALLALIEARTYDLYDDILPEWQDLEGYCGETSSALVRLACIILAKGEEPGAVDAAGHAGVAYALTGLLRAFPWHARRGQVYLPQVLMTATGVSRGDIVNGRDSEGLRAALGQMRARARMHLSLTRALIGGVPSRLAPAFLPLAAVERYLDAMERPDYDPFTTLIDISHLSRLWLVWRQAKRAAARS
jgi:phytoene synthase